MRLFFTDPRGNPILESFQQRRLRQRLRRAVFPHHTNRSTLLVAVRNRAWESVVRRCRTHPHELLSAIDKHTGNTALHEACRLDPPADVIRAMGVHARVANHQGATPLHIAASHRCNAAALRVLLQEAALRKPPQLQHAEPKELDDEDESHAVAATADLSNMGRAPIHYACTSFRGLDMESFRVLFEATIQTGQVRHLEPINKNGDELMDELEDFVEDEDKEMKEIENQPGCVDQNVTRLGNSREDSKRTLRAKGLASLSDDNGDSKPKYRMVNVLGLKDATGQTPLGLLFRRYRERVRHVINRLDRIHNHSSDQSKRGPPSRRRHQQGQDRSALVAALIVQGELGELWGKARWIVARLSEERLAEEECNVASKTTMETVKGEGLEEDITTSNFTKEASTALSSPSPKQRKFRFVHASVGLTGFGCPPEMIRLAISVHPSQVREMDEDGNLPLHIAALASSHLATADDVASCGVSFASALLAAADNTSLADDNTSVLSDAAMSFFSSATISQTTHPFDKVIKILLHHYPEAARIPQGGVVGGCLPLTMAVHHRTWDDGIRSLVNAHPAAVHDPAMQLLAAAATTTTTQQAEHASTSLDVDLGKSTACSGKLYPKILTRVMESACFSPVEVVVVGGTHLLTVNSSRPRGVVNNETGSSPTLQQRSPSRRAALFGTTSTSQRALRHQACVRTTLFELLRAKPEWLTQEKES